jgi:hypothetical protein
MQVIATTKKLRRFIIGSSSNWFSLTLVPLTQVGCKIDRHLAGEPTAI